MFSIHKYSRPFHIWAKLMNNSFINWNARIKKYESNKHITAELRLLLNLIIFALLVYGGKPKYFIRFENFKQDVVYVVEYALVSCVIFLKVIQKYTVRKQTVEMMDRMYDFDCEMQRYGIKVGKRDVHSRRISLSLMQATISIISGFFLVYFYFLCDIRRSIALKFFIIFLANTVGYYELHMHYIIWDRYCLVTSILRSCAGRGFVDCDICNGACYSDFSNICAKHTIAITRVLYGTLFETVTAWQKSCPLRIMYFVGIVQFLSDMQIFLIIIFKLHPISNNALLANHLVAVFYYPTILSTTILIFLIPKQASDVGHLLHRIYLQMPDEINKSAVGEEIKSFSFQVLQDPVIIIVMGMEYNNQTMMELMHSVFTAVSLLITLKYYL